MVSSPAVPASEVSTPVAASAVAAASGSRRRSPPLRAVGGRVLLVVHNAEPGGAERMALAEAAHLAGAFELLISVPEGPLRDAFAAHGELLRGFATLPLWGGSAKRWAGRSARTLRDGVRMAGLIRSRRVELVLTNSSVCLAPVLAARLAGVPVVVHARDVPKSRLAPLVFAVQGALAQTVVVIAGGLAPYFRRGRRARVAQIADGIVIGPPARRAGGFQSPLRLCVIGGIDRRKGQDVAVAALALLREQGLEATLVLVGREIDSAFADAVRDDVARLGLGQAVEFVGEVADAGPQLARADIVVAPSRGEWTPLVLMEALAAGVPVVASRVGGVADVVHDRESGLLVASEDPSALAAAIAELAADPPSALAMAERGRRHVERDFKIERTLEQLEAELLRLL
jgi:glycosyltransferase involved in cell wall biosynthesis